MNRWHTFNCNWPIGGDCTCNDLHTPTIPKCAACGQWHNEADCPTLHKIVTDAMTPDNSHAGQAPESATPETDAILRLGPFHHYRVEDVLETARRLERQRDEALAVAGELAKYAGHQVMCQDGNKPCRCGLSAALARHAKLKQTYAMTPHERAERVIEEAARQGMDAPTEDMIAAAIQDAEADALTNPVEVAQKHHGWEDGGSFVDAVREAVGTLAERAALDLDHGSKFHKEWYRAVKTVRRLVRLHPETGE